MAEKIKYICELCRREITPDKVGWKGTFVVCKKCQDYLAKKKKGGWK